MPSRFGFTLTEVLVTTALMAVLIGVLLPAVQTVREAARRMQCSNQLRQVGLAFQNYDAVHRQLPKGGAGAVSLTQPTVKNRTLLSWGAAILPFLEQAALYDQINLDQPYLHASNLAAGHTIVPTYLCPSAPKVSFHRPNGDTPSSTVRFARSDYGGNYGERGLRCYPAKGCPNHYVHQGITEQTGRGTLLIGSEREIRMRDILDGASQTILVGEAPEARHGIWIGHKNVFDQSAPINAQVATPSHWSSCHPLFKSGSGDFCDFGQEFHSYHPGGAMFSFADGSAHFLSESIDLDLFSALLSRRGQEVVTAF